MVVAVVIGMALLSSMAGLWLAFDACKRRRIERQLAAVLPAAAAGPQPLSLRRAQVRTKWQFFHRLINYDPGIVYAIRPLYTLPIAAVAFLAILYVGNIFWGSGDLPSPWWPPPPDFWSHGACLDGSSATLPIGCFSSCLMLSS
jgi:hypothetical protein